MMVFVKMSLIDERQTGKYELSFGTIVRARRIPKSPKELTAKRISTRADP